MPLTAHGFENSSGHAQLGRAAGYRRRSVRLLQFGAANISLPAPLNIRKEAEMLRIGIAFLLGHCCIHGLAALPAWYPWAVALCALLVPLAMLRWSTAATLVLGALWAWGNAAVRLADDMPAELEGEDVLVGGHIASLPDLVDGDPQFDVDVTTAPATVPSRIRLTWYDTDVQPNAGELWQFVVRLKRRNGFANPGGFDYEGYLFRAGIGASGYVREDSRNRRLAAASPRYAVLRVRAWIAQRLHDATGNHSMLGVLQGLAVGDTRAMSAEQWRVFAATGTTHLMAISGLHISMIAALSAWFGGALSRRPLAQRLRIGVIEGQVIGGLCGAVAYSMLAGLSVPTQRTLMMLCIYFGARGLRRELGVGHAIGIALIGVLLVDPFAPLAVGAWLSFAAVAVILLAVSGRLGTEGTIRSFARVQFAVTLGLIPVLIAAFGSLSLIAPAANALAVPLFTLFLVPIVLVGAGAASVWLPAGVFFLGFAARVLDWCWPALDWLAQLPIALWYFPRIPALLWAVLAVGALLFVAPAIWPLRIVAALLCLPALTYRAATPSAGEFQLTLLDVGQGLSAVIRTQSHVLVYDAGPAFRTGRDTGELVVLPYLRSQGVRRIDTLMISHGDLDHRGGMPSILRGMTVDRVQSGPSVTNSTRQVHPCRRGQRWVWDQVEFEVLHPADDAYVRDNDSSCVLRIAGAGGSVLLTGDIQRDAEAALLAARLAPSDVVVVPHHGSNTSSTADFVAATRPRLALFATGYRNRWGFPKPAVTERWRAAGAATFSTVESGAIEVTMGAAGPQRLRQYRLDERRYWWTR
jgi:competence protein ComEC